MISSRAKGSLLAVVIILIGVILSFVINPLLAWGGLTLFMVGALLLGGGRRILLATGVWSLVAPLIEQLVGPASNADEALMVGCAICVIGFVVLKRERLLEDQFLLFCLIGLFLIFSFSYVVNRPPLFVATNSLVSYYSFPLIFALAIHERNERMCRMFISISVWFLLLQVVLNVGWIAGINPLPNRHAAARIITDICHGSIGRADWLAYASIALTFLFVSVGRHAQTRRVRQGFYALAFLSLLQFGFTYTNHAFPYLFACAGVYVVLLADRVSSLVKYVVIMIVIAVFSAVVMQAVQTKTYGDQSENITELFSKQNLDHRWRKFKRAPKMKLIETVTVDWAHTHPIRWWVGLGPGNGTSAIGMTRVSPGAYELLADFYLTTTGRQERWGSSLLESTYSGLTAIWSELGFLGYLLYHALYWVVLFRVCFRVRRKEYAVVAQRILAEAFVPSMFLFIISSFLNDLFFSDFWLVSIWLWAGLVFYPLPANRADATQVQGLA